MDASNLAYPEPLPTVPMMAAPQTYEDAYEKLRRISDAIKPMVPKPSPAVAPAKSDGGSTVYYQLPDYAKELADLIEHKNMNFNRGNIFKAAYRLGEKDGTADLYDLRKIIFFATREISRIERLGTTNVPTA